MIKGRFIKKDTSEVLNVGETYFLFPHGHTHFYVSKFPNPKAHTGCYHKDQFEIIRKEWTPVTGESCSALLTETGTYTLEKKRYYGRMRKTHINIYNDPDMTSYKGCFPVEWFSKFERLDEPDIIIEETELEEYEEEVPVLEQEEQLSLF